MSDLAPPPASGDAPSTCVRGRSRAQRLPTEGVVRAGRGASTKSASNTISVAPSGDSERARNTFYGAVAAEVVGALASEAVLLREAALTKSGHRTGDAIGVARGCHCVTTTPDSRRARGGDRAAAGHEANTRGRSRRAAATPDRGRARGGGKSCALGTPPSVRVASSPSGI